GVPGGRPAPRLRALPREVRGGRAPVHLLRVLRRGVPVRRDPDGHGYARRAVRLARPVHLRPRLAALVPRARRLVRDAQPAARAGRRDAPGARPRAPRRALISFEGSAAAPLELPTRRSVALAGRYPSVPLR